MFMQRGMLKGYGIKFDVAEFYPFISEYLLKKLINYAKSFTAIEENCISAIKLACKSLLFNKDGTWIKKSDNELFDVTMGSFDGTEIWELVGLYLLNKLSKLLWDDNVGLYRDKMRKNIIAIFEEEGLTMTIDTNLIETDFLDETFNLAMGKFFAFRKPNNAPLYIKVKSNHTLTIIKDLWKMIKGYLSYLVIKISLIKQSCYTKNHY